MVQWTPERKRCLELAPKALPKTVWAHIQAGNHKVVLHNTFTASKVPFALRARLRCAFWSNCGVQFWQNVEAPRPRLGGGFLDGWMDGWTDGRMTEFWLPFVNFSHLINAGYTGASAGCAGIRGRNSATLKVQTLNYPTPSRASEYLMFSPSKSTKKAQRMIPLFSEHISFWVSLTEFHTIPQLQLSFLCDSKLSIFNASYYSLNCIKFSKSWFHPWFTY